jgi:glycosyltransferase involved in cell wall biosynthesis
MSDNKHYSEELISVIVNCHNSQEFLDDCIGSILCQSHKNFEIIALDNASVDQTAEMLKNYSDERVKYHYFADQMPLYAARNKAIDVCKGRYVCFLDSDDVMAPNRLSSQLRFLKDHNKCFIFSDYQEMSSGGLIKPLSMVGNATADKLKPSDLLRKNVISIGAVFMETDLLTSNRFDERLLLMGDLELWLRLCMKEDFLFHPEVVEYSRKHSNSTSELYRELWLSEKIYVFKKLFALKPRAFLSFYSFTFLTRAIVSHLIR